MVMVSIRWKLFLSLFVLTAAATAAVLWLAEREFRALTRDAVQERFTAQIDGLLRGRAERLAETRRICSELATDELVIRELREPGKSDGRAADFIARLRELQGIEEEAETPRFRRPRPGPSPGPTRNPMSQLPYVGIVTLDGEMRSLGRALPSQARNRRRRPPAQVRELARERTQAVSYVVVDGDRQGAGKRVQEFVVTPVADESDEVLGWFFLGLNAVTPEQQAFQRAEKASKPHTGSTRHARTGLVVDDQWFVPDLSDEDRDQLLAARTETSWDDLEPNLVELSGERFLLATAALNPESPLGQGYQVTLFPIGTLIDAVEELRWKVAGLAVVAALLAALVALFLSARFSRPIAALVAGTERVRRGEFEGDVHVRSKDELGRLADAFNLMTRDLALKERYREVLVKVSDPAVARRLIEGELELGGEVVEASVLFCDIRGFTALTDGMPPAEVIELLNEHMTALTRLVYEHGGAVDKFVGDLVMAIFGAPQSHGDDALRAARCAVAMIEERRALDERTGREVRIGVGVAHGPLVAGCMGSNDRLNYTVLGDRVNLASRLCDQAGSSEVLVDGGVAAAASAEFRAIPRDSLSLRGFAEPVAAYLLEPESPSDGDQG